MQTSEKNISNDLNALAPYLRLPYVVVLVREFFRHYVNPSDTVLDLGSGWGEFILKHSSRAKSRWCVPN